MVHTPLFQEIAETIRQAIFYGKLKPGDELPTVRDMSAQWNCAPGTVQRAYQELSQQGLVTSRPGQGTRVADTTSSSESRPLRRAALVHDAESFLLGALSAGYTPHDVEQAVRQALDRWRGMAEEVPPPAARVVRFIGSHDPAISEIAARFDEIAPGYALHISFAGSLGGLIALAEHKADVAGCHLWDEETDTYNRPFVQRLLPGRRVALLTLAYRCLGLILPPGNPAGITGLHDLAQTGQRFVNRQPGAGTRVWLDAQLRRLGVSPQQINGYDGEPMTTHLEVARAVAENRASVGLGVEAAALSYGLDFINLTTERYDLVIPSETWTTAPVQRLTRWLATDEARAILSGLGGCDIRGMGRVEWME